MLLIKRGGHPYLGCWALPGGFVNPDETADAAALRELEEETGVTDVPIELFGMYGAPGRDPRGWTVSGGFCTVLDGDRDVRAGDDAADARWCPIHVGEMTEGRESPCRDLEVICGANEALHVRFRPVPQRFGNPRAHVISHEGFAFDHAHLLAEAYLAVR